MESVKLYQRADDQHSCPAQKAEKLTHKSPNKGSMNF